MNTFTKINQYPTHVDVKDCKLDWTNNGMITSVYYIPKYDENGFNINPDGNVTMKYATCSECGKTWEAKTQYETVFTKL